MGASHTSVHRAVVSALCVASALIPNYPSVNYPSVKFDQVQERSRQLERQQSLRVEIEDTLTPRKASLACQHVKRPHFPGSWLRLLHGSVAHSGGATQPLRSH